jgi:hypothetical protein
MHEEMNELLDLIPYSEVKPVVLRLKNLFLEVDEVSFYASAKDLLNGENISLGLKEAAGIAFFRPRLIEIDPIKREKIRQRVFRDLMFILREDSLIREKEESKEKLKDCSALDEAKNLMTKIFEIEKELDRLKMQR